MPPDEGFGPCHKDRGEEVAEVPHEGREQPTIEGPKARALDLSAQRDDSLTQEQVLRDERDAGSQHGEHEVSQKLQEGGHGSSGLTMGRAREVAYGDRNHHEVRVLERRSAHLLLHRCRHRARRRSPAAWQVNVAQRRGRQLALRLRCHLEPVAKAECWETGEIRENPYTGGGGLRTGPALQPIREIESLACTSIQATVSLGAPSR